MEYVGILLDHSRYKSVPKENTGSEKIPYYNIATKKHDLIPFYTSLPNIDIKKNNALGYEYINKKYRKVRRPIPKVIHNRSMPFSGNSLTKLNQLHQKSIVFNGKTRYPKYYIHQILMKNHEIVPYLPKTIMFSKRSLQTMMEQYSELYLKPLSSSLGKGIIKLTKQTNSKKWLIRSLKTKEIVSEKQVYSRVKQLKLGQSYLIQKGIALATYKGNPYDIRVTVQRGSDGNWKIVGLIGKIASNGSPVTNAASGGKVVKVPPLFLASGLNVANVEARINHLSIIIAEQLSKSLKNLADIGLDIGIDKNGKPYFIEMNGRDQRYGFKMIHEKNKMLQSYENPILYSKYLLRNNYNNIT